MRYGHPSILLILFAEINPISFFCAQAPHPEVSQTVTQMEIHILVALLLWKEPRVTTVDKPIIISLYEVRIQLMALDTLCS